MAPAHALDHGPRVALRAGLATTAAEPLHPHRGHWLLLTVALVVKPDAGSVLVRGLHRALGTLGATPTRHWPRHATASNPLVHRMGLLADTATARAVQSYVSEAAPSVSPGRHETGS
ncbi:FUSC family protein [Streptomyces sp. 110]|uniref:FUSC family protein n=1 Tax=Streptomyces endocoffeicus TaxID=2898945 RepID=A0ABS1Q1Q9_9ACTN|nr:FUSC family protein [Streptomyces endocoffeicus]MBL1118180.1 FUSC family protein [Streptomyces endocoffeicus]